MHPHRSSAPGQAARTLGAALTSGLLVIGLALEVAVATVNEQTGNLPVNVPANRSAPCADAPQAQQAADGCGHEGARDR
jgi:hypothetical protein